MLLLIEGRVRKTSGTDKDNILHTLAPSTLLPTPPNSRHSAVRNRHISYVPFVLSSYCLSYPSDRLDVRVTWIVSQPMKRLVSRLGYISVRIAGTALCCCNPLRVVEVEILTVCESSKNTFIALGSETIFEMYVSTALMTSIVNSGNLGCHY